MSAVGTACGDGDGSHRGGLSFEFRANVASSCELILHTLQLTRRVDTYIHTYIYITSSSGNRVFVCMYIYIYLKGACIYIYVD